MARRLCAGWPGLKGCGESLLRQALGKGNAPMARLLLKAGCPHAGIWKTLSVTRLFAEANLDILLLAGERVAYPQIGRQARQGLLKLWRDFRRDAEDLRRLRAGGHAVSTGWLRHIAARKQALVTLVRLRRFWEIYDRRNLPKGCFARAWRIEAVRDLIVQGGIDDAGQLERILRPRRIGRL